MYRERKQFMKENKLGDEDKYKRHLTENAFLRF